MAFNEQNIGTIAGQIGGRIQFYDYFTTDDQATVLSTGYFNALANKVVKNNYITVQQRDVSGDTVLQYYVRIVSTGYVPRSVVVERTSFDNVNEATTDNAIARFDGATGSLQNSGVIIDDLDNITGTGNIIPKTDNTSELGSETKTYKNAHFTDENGTYFTQRELAKLHRDYSACSAIKPYLASYETVAGVWTVTITADDSSPYLAFTIDDKVLRSTGNTLSVDGTSFAGTDLLPKTVYIYVENDGSDLPVLVASNTSPDDTHIPHAHIANYKVGTVGTSSTNIYAKIDDAIEMKEIASNVYHRFFQQGTVYNSGLSVTATTTDITIGVGNYTLIYSDITTLEKQVSIDGLYYIKNDNTYNTITDFSFGGEYADGVTIGNNKYFNVVLGVLEDDTTRIHGLVQNGSSEEYISFTNAFEDKKSQTRYIPRDSLLKNIFVPVCRIVVKNTGGTYTLQQFDDGNYYQDLRGSVGSSGGATSGASNTVDGNVDNDSLFWNTTTGQYEPKTIAEAKEILGVEDFTITSFADLSSGTYTTGTYHIATVTTGIFTKDYIYLKTDTSWTEVTPFEKQQIFLDSNKLPYYYDGTSWSQVAGRIPLQTKIVTLGSPQTIVEIKDIPVDDYSSFEIEISGLRAVSNQVDLYMRTSVDNGVTYPTVGYYYTLDGTIGITQVASSRSNYSSIGFCDMTILNRLMGNGLGTESLNAKVHIHNSQDELLWRTMRISSEYNEVTSALPIQLSGMAQIQSQTNRTNALQFFASSGDIERGTFKLYGIK